MIHKRFSSKDWNGFIKSNNLDDVIDLRRFGFRNFKDLKELTKSTTERAASQKCKDVISEFFHGVALNMIDDRAVFVFPMRRFGFMRIGDIGNDPGGNKYNKRIQDDFLVPGGKVHLDPLIRRVNGGKDYRFKMIQPLLKRLRNNKIKGTRYVE